MPTDKLSWSPHAKSMSLGQLALHVATIPGNLTKLTQFDEFDVAQANFNPPQPKGMSEILTAVEESVRSAEGYLGTMADTFASANWRLTMRGKELFSKPRIAVLRSVLLNHWYHHRGQLSVYLRLLDVPVPVICGRSADEYPLGCGPWHALNNPCHLTKL